MLLVPKYHLPKETPQPDPNIKPEPTTTRHAKCQDIDENKLKNKTENTNAN
jgi:hypothetical protein